MSFVCTPEAAIGDDTALLVRRLTAKTGRAMPSRVTRLAGGRNNQVYRLDSDDGPLVLKCYFNDARDHRDRLGAEWSFIGHAWSRGIRSVPEPIAVDADARCALYGFVAGRKLTAAELTAAHVDAALDFVLAVNEPPRPALAPASEACFSLAEHLATIERRVARLCALDDAAPHIAEARRLVARRLVPAWTEVKRQALAGAQAAGLVPDQIIADDEACLSPSDFGFHNALIDDRGRLTFLDFEYAGRDDPAKLVSDLFCQPEAPVPLALHAYVVDRLARGLGLDDAAIARCRLLLCAYRIKWACILLNDFLPLGAARRAFADQGAREQRCAEQLAKAEALLAALGGTPP